MAFHLFTDAERAQALAIVRTIVLTHGGWHPAISEEARASYEADMAAGLLEVLRRRRSAESLWPA